MRLDVFVYEHGRVNVFRFLPMTRPRPTEAGHLQSFFLQFSGTPLARLNDRVRHSWNRLR